MITYDKIVQLILYVIKTCEKEWTGITIMKLYKILYFIDFGFYATQGKSITNLNYLRFTYGPVPMGLNDYLKIMEDNGDIDKKDIMTEKGEKTVYIAMKNGKLKPSLFPESEIELINVTLEALKNQFAKTASIKTHYHHSWITTNKGEIIPYETSKFCDFEWLNYYSQDKNKQDFKEVESTRKLFRSSDRLQGLMAQVQNQ